MKKKQAPVIYLDRVFLRVMRRMWLFVCVFTVIFFVCFTTLAMTGIAPRPFAFRPSVLSSVVPSVEPAKTVIVKKGEGELPVRIEIPEVGIEATVANPTQTDIHILDTALLGGAVRYPGTGVLGEEGNVLLFGHSSHLPVVHNKAYKAFNDIQKLKAGDPIYVYGEKKRYTYAVESVKQENTTTGAIPLDVGGAKITLATCDNFGAKTDRFVVTAVLVSVREQPNP